MIKILEEIAQNPNPANPRLLVKLVQKLRPSSPQKPESAEAAVRELIELLTAHPHLAGAFSNYVSGLLADRYFLRSFTSSGIFSGEGFSRELWRKFYHSILPPLYLNNDISEIINEVFYKKTDYLWVDALPDELLSELLTVMHLTEVCRLPASNAVIEQILNSIVVVSHRLVSLGIENELLDKIPELEELESPFLAQNKEVLHYADNFRKEGFDRSTFNEDYKQILVLLGQCEYYMELIKKNKGKFGADLNLTHLMLRVLQHIERLSDLFSLLDISQDPYRFEKEIYFFKKMVRNENRKFSISNHVSGNFELLAFQVTEHAGRTGEHYITNTAREWFRMMKSAMGAGIIVGFLCIFKLYFYYRQLPPFGQAFFYSMNYSFGFMAIHMSGSTLATKQPAMTASKIAGSLDVKNEDKTALDSLADLIVKVSRTQTIAFFGNVVLAFPVAYAMAWVIFMVTGEKYADEHKAWEMIADIHPFRSASLFYAAIAGVYLFISGLISGYYDNKNIYYRIPERIKKHPFLQKILKKNALDKLAGYVENNMGSLAGNFFFGIFLGSTATVGGILGLPLDIRHITFSAGNFGIALATLGLDLPLKQILICLFGILGIGLVNFSVSFGLALFVAIRSRGVKFTATPVLAQKVLIRFGRNPLLFFFPPFFTKKVEEEIASKSTEPQNQH